MFKTKYVVTKNILLLIIIIANSFAFAQVGNKKKMDSQKEKFELNYLNKVSIAVDVVYPNLSRGILLNTERIAFQPSIEYNFSKKFSVGAWATTNFSSNATAYNEYDFTIAYQVLPYLIVELADYYTPATKQNSITYGGYRTPFLDFDIYSAQVLELCFDFNFSSKGVPIDFQWNTLIYGNDFKDVVKDNQGNVVSKKRAFSSYSEIGYTYKTNKYDFKFRPFIGAAVINEAGYYGYYRNGKTGFSFINVGLNIDNKIKIIKNYPLPVFLQYTYNEDGNYNADRTKLKYNFISAGITFNIIN